MQNLWDMKRVKIVIDITKRALCLFYLAFLKIYDIIAAVLGKNRFLQEWESMKKKLISIDLDGSLLREDCTISERNRQAILKAMDQGHLVVPATGRGYKNSRYVLKDFPVMPYYVNANGTTVTRGEPEQALFSCTISCGQAHDIYRLAREYSTFIELYHGLDAFDSHEGCEYMKKSGCMEAYRHQLLKTNVHMEAGRLDDFVLKENRAISKFHIMCTSLADKQELMERISELPGVYPISTASHNIEIADSHWSKKDGLVWLCEHIGFDREQVLAIGDSDNDYDAICWAGCGVAMRNACSRVRQAADHITGTNEEDGVAQALEEFLER